MTGLYVLIGGGPGNPMSDIVYNPW
jgi:hypothetical protein